MKDTLQLVSVCLLGFSLLLRLILFLTRPKNHDER